MGTPGPTPSITLEETLELFTGSANPCAPLTATEVSAELDCTRRTAHRKLEQLVERGDLATKKAGARSRVWWRPVDLEGSAATGDREAAQFGDFVDAVEDYAIFMLDPDGNVASWNRGAERIKGYAEEAVLGEHVSVFYTDEAVDEGVPEANLERAASDGAVEDEGWRVREDGSRFWANVVITAIRDDDGELRGFTKVTRDLTERREYEQQLRRERNQTEELLRTAPVAITVQDADGDTVLANQRARELWGSAEPVFVDEPDDGGEWSVYDASGELLAPAERPSARARAIREPVSERELAIETASGERRWLSVSASPVFGPDGELDRVITTGEDVTPLKRRERQLERRRSELETELSEVFGRVSDAFYALDADWRFTHVNERAEGLLQRTREELLERRLWDVFPDATDTVIWDRFHRAMEAQEPASFEFAYDELGAWFEINAYPSETGMSVYFQDITERKARDRELERYRTIVETVEDGIYTVDREGRFTMVNEAYAELTGYPREELLGSHVSLVVDEAVTERAREIEQGLQAGEGDAMVEADIHRADGGTVPAEATFALLPSEDGHQRIGVVRDISARRAQERALEESERRYRALAEHFPNGAVGVYDHDLRYTLVAGAAVGDTLPSADRVEGKRVADVYPDDVVAQLEPLCRAAVEAGETGNIQIEVSGRHWQVWATPLHDADGEIFAGLSFAQDVTEQVEREQYLEDAKSQLEAATEAGAVGTWEWRVEEDEMVVGASFARTFGVDPEAAREGVSLERFISSIHEADRDRVERGVEEAVASCGDYEAEYRVRDADGDVRWVVARGHVECDEDGNPVAFPGALTDITDRKRAELQLQRNKTQLETLFAVLPVGVVVAASDGEIVAANDAAHEIWGGDVFDAGSIEEYEQYPAYWADTGDPVEPEEMTLARVARGEEVTEPDVLEIDAADGERRIIELAGMPIQDATGGVSRGVVTMADVTERREYRRKLEESNERLEQFAYVASHDLQEPLRMVSSYLQLVEDRYADELDEDGQEFIEFAVDGAERMREMIDDLLAYSRLDTQAEPLEPTECDAVVEDALGNLRLQIEESGAEVDVEPLPTVPADENQLEQVFQNLVANAIKYRSDEPPRIEIGAELDAGVCTFRVADNGIGMDPERADRIFEVFKRLHSAEEYPGTGIGLALCEKIVRRHGGDIWVETEIGEGSTFYFSIPNSGNHDDDDGQ